MMSLSLQVLVPGGGRAERCQPAGRWHGSPSPLSTPQLAYAQPDQLPHRLHVPDLQGVSIGLGQGIARLHKLG